ncbi:nitrilase-related carbon-nitrogen hydrolase [Caulobacter sp. KR2-114]|uniref:nitrilase-related carbon-nitrogen hydrolase n=1 Tax=Caulobacter sp. KR2-114 TaxID=3400912 RepID=UPI003C0C5C5D
MASITETAPPALGRAGVAAVPAARWLWLAIGAAAALLSTGGRWDIAVAAWIAPVFLLRFARTSAPAVAIAAVVAVSGAQIAGYMLETAAPFNAMTTALCLALGAIFAVPYLLDRLLAPRLGEAGRVLLLPAATAMTEFAAASLLPVGASIGVKAITQSETLALAQIVSLLGPYAIGFLIALAASVANQIWETPSRRVALRLGGALAAVMLAVLGFGEARLTWAAARPAGETVKVAGVVPPMALRAPAWSGVSMASYPPSPATLAAVATPSMRAADAAARAALLDGARAAAAAGARVILWSETAAPALEADKGPFLQQVSALARQAGVYVDAAVGVPYARNETFLIGPDGGQLWHYRKNHPVPGMEPVAPFANAPPVADTPYGRLSNVICFDGDFPALARVPADILLLPGWDWPEEGYNHTMKAARLRAIENGYSLVRVDYWGLSGAFDPFGRVLAMQDTVPGKAYAMLVDVPVKGVTTAYARIGDAFAWLCALAVLALATLALARPRRAGD